MRVLRYDENATGRMQRLLTGESNLLADYQLADMATVKDLFLTTFARSGADFSTDLAKDGRQSTQRICEARVPERSTSASNEGMSRFQDMEDALELGRLGDQLCRTVQDNGKAAVSIWQLRRHLHMYGHDAATAVCTASILLTDPRGMYPDSIDSMPTATWLNRCCLGHLAPAFDKAGYAQAMSLYGISNDDLGKCMKITDAQTKNTLMALLEFKENRPDLLVQCGMLRRAVSCCAQRFSMSISCMAASLCGACMAWVLLNSERANACVPCSMQNKTDFCT